MEKNKLKKMIKNNVVIVVPNLVCGAINVHTAARKKNRRKKSFEISCETMNGNRNRIR